MNKTARLSRHLLATAYLALAVVGAAHATTISESQAPGGDFGNTFTAATQLSSIAALTIPGSNTVTGAVTPTGAQVLDWFYFNGEPIGDYLSWDISDLSSGTVLEAYVVNSQGKNVTNGAGATAIVFSPASDAIGNAFVPANGAVFVGIEFDTCSGCTHVNYSATVVAVAPEPGTMGDVGLALGLAGVVALRRRFRPRTA
jgi:hypothetical protein